VVDHNGFETEAVAAENVPDFRETSDSVERRTGTETSSSDGGARLPPIRGNQHQQQSPAVVIETNLIQPQRRDRHQIPAQITSNKASKRSHLLPQSSETSAHSREASDPLTDADVSAGDGQPNTGSGPGEKRKQAGKLSRKSEQYLNNSTIKEVSQVNRRGGDGYGKDNDEGEQSTVNLNPSGSIAGSAPGTAGVGEGTGPSGGRSGVHTVRRGHQAPGTRGGETPGSKESGM
jgi:hypothetical protein